MKVERQKPTNRSEARFKNALEQARQIVLRNVDKTGTEVVVNDFMENKMLQAALDYLVRKVQWVTAKQVYLQSKGPQVGEELARFEGVK